MLDYDPDIDYAPEAERRPKRRIDPAIYQHYVDLRRSKQHYQFALVGGTLGAALGVALWLGVSMTAHVEAEWIAIGVGLLAGGSVRFCGQGFDRVFGVLGALLTAIGCFAGTLIAGCHFVALQTEGATLIDAISTLTPTMTREIFIATFDPLDGVFYGIAVVLGFRISFRRLSGVDKATLWQHSEPQGEDAHADAA
jgi:hypothetical protein